jgi:hypothetical protein
MIVIDELGNVVHTHSEYVLINTGSRSVRSGRSQYMVYKALVELSDQPGPYSVSTIFDAVRGFDGPRKFGLKWTRQRLYSLIASGLVKKISSGKKATYELAE